MKRNSKNSDKYLAKIGTKLKILVARSPSPVSGYWEGKIMTSTSINLKIGVPINIS